MKETPLKNFAELLSIFSSSTRLVTSVAIDSRKIEKGALFFALPGARVDGHSYLEEAASKGAVGAFVQEGYKGENFGLDLIFVPNVLLALQDLGRKQLARSNAKVIAITGSIGKTTTKEFTFALLEESFKVAKSPLSYNTQSTLPLSILMNDSDVDLFILEMGMTHKGDLEKLLSIAPPDIAVITTVALQHANNFPDGLEGITNEKGTLFSHPKTKLGIFHRDITYFNTIMGIGKFPKLHYSLEDRSADFFFDGKILYHKEEKIPFSITLPLKPHYQNFLAAVIVARSLGLPWDVIQKRASTLKLPPQRFEFIDKNGILFINDAFNANPDATKAALEHMPSPQKNGKKIAVLTEMNALGEYAAFQHKLIGEIALKCVDLLLCLGKNCTVMEKIWEKNERPVVCCETKMELLEALQKHAKPGDVVLLKGARAYALEDFLNHF